MQKLLTGVLVGPDRRPPGTRRYEVMCVDARRLTYQNGYVTEEYHVSWVWNGCYPSICEPARLSGACA